VALKHDELKEMGIASVGHRLTILKNVYEIKVNQDIPIDSDHYIPSCMAAAVSAQQKTRLTRV
jgi:protein STE50